MSANTTDRPFIFLVNGPNLNLLGQREPHIYGRVGLDEICQGLVARAGQSGYALEWMQSNSESDLIEAIQKAQARRARMILINAASLTHTSIGIRDALSAAPVPFIELHLSNIWQREEFRHKSLLADRAVGVICGFKAASYDLALRAAIDYLKTQAPAGQPDA